MTAMPPAAPAVRPSPSHLCTIGYMTHEKYMCVHVRSTKAKLLIITCVGEDKKNEAQIQFSTQQQYGTNIKTQINTTPGFLVYMRARDVGLLANSPPHLHCVYLTIIVHQS